MPTCFVVQGFGKKTDFESGRVLDLDASYEVIKEAVKAAGYDCMRADEIRTTRHIEEVMYEQLWNADLVIADLSTMNVNAFFELGVRFALRPGATIVVAEEKINFPFDVGHIPIRTYTHLGDDIGRREATRFINSLTELIGAIDPTATDSPVFTMLRSLPRPVITPIVVAAEPNGETPDQSLADLKRQAKEAMNNDLVTAASLWAEIRRLGPKDDHVVQQQALATYKSKYPDELQALHEARAILEDLWPHESLDPETLGLWAAVHKRLHALTEDSSALDEAITATERGFVLRRDYYNGINLAYLLDTRAGRGDQIAAREDHAHAMSIRRQVADICQTRLAADDLTPDEHYWVLATLQEAAIGLGDETAATRWATEATKHVSEAGWWVDSTTEQLDRLRAILADINAKVGF